MTEIKSLTLPISCENGLYMNCNESRALGDLLSEQYKNAKPFPHIVIDDIFPNSLINDILTHFPTFYPQKNKSFSSQFTVDSYLKKQTLPYNLGAFELNLFNFLNSAPILQFLEHLTGIHGLIPDPYFSGGGFHETLKGGLLGLHADFRLNNQLHLERRVNLLVYLNNNWENSFGGFLEIFDNETPDNSKLIAPILNRCVIFNTDENSYHGHPDPLNTPENISRKSLALYYYTASKNIYNEVPNKTTVYICKSTDSDEKKRAVRKLRLNNYLQDFLPPILYRGIFRIKKILHI